MRSKVLAGALALLAIILFLARRSHAPGGNHKFVAVHPKKTERVAMHAKGGGKLPEADLSEAPDESTDPAAVAEGAAGFVGVPLKTVDGDLEIPVTMKIQSSCSEGEVDLINLYSQGGGLLGDPGKGGFDLRLSLEPLARGSSVPTQSISISKAELQAGFNHTFRMAPVTDPTPMGVFLCSDTTQQRGCQEKTTSNLDQMFVEKLRASKKEQFFKIGESIRNHIFFFQFVMVQPKWLKIWPKEDFTSKDYANLGRVLRLEWSASTQPLVDRVARWNKDMASLAPKNADQQVAFFLNRLDPSTCKPLARTPVRTFERGTGTPGKPGDPRFRPPHVIKIPASAYTKPDNHVWMPAGATP